MGDSVEHGAAGFETILTQDELDFLQPKMPKGFTLITTPKLASITNKHSKNSASTSNHRLTGSHAADGGDADPSYGPGSKNQRDNRKDAKVITNTAVISAQFNNMGGNLQTSSTGVTTRPTNKQPVVMSELMKKCQTLLKRLQSHNSAAPFLDPVDHKALNIPDYPLIVKEPMDLSTVERKLKEGMYASPAAFGADVRKIWSNAYLYNPNGSPICELTKKMDDFFEKYFKEIQDSPLADGNLAGFMDPKLTGANKKIDSLKTKGAHSEIDPLQKPMTTEEKFTLALQIRSSISSHERPPSRDA